MRNRRQEQAEMQGPAKPEVPQMRTEKGSCDLKCTAPRSSLAPASLSFFSCSWYHGGVQSPYLGDGVSCVAQSN